MGSGLGISVLTIPSFGLENENIEEIEGRVSTFNAKHSRLLSLESQGKIQVPWKGNNNITLLYNEEKYDP